MRENDRQPVPRCGDHVLYRPEGQEYVVAFADAERDIIEWVEPVGSDKPRFQPLMLSDCKLIRRMSDPLHSYFVEAWIRNAPPQDYRRQHIIRLYLPEGHEARRQMASSLVGEPSVKPKRIQLLHTKGWRVPTGTVAVTPRTRWSNSYKVGDPDPITGKPMTAEDAVAWYTAGLDPALNPAAEAERYWIRRELRGKDLGCACPVGRSCHVDVLLEIANS